MDSATAEVQHIVSWAERETHRPPAYQGFGRPPSLTYELADRIGAVIQECSVKPAVAARKCWVAQRTFDRWIAKGKEDDEAGKPTVYAYLWQVIDVKDAESECGLILDAKSGRLGWQGPMTVASRRHEGWQDKSIDNNGPKVVVLIGADAKDVHILGETNQAVVDAEVLSPPLTGDLHRLTAEN